MPSVGAHGRAPTDSKDLGAWRSRRGPASGSNRVKRGGSWNNNAINVRVANRNNNGPGDENNNVGFRLVSTPHGKDALSHPRTPAPRADGDKHGRPEGASTSTYKRRGNAPAGAVGLSFGRQGWSSP